MSGWVFVKSTSSSEESTVPIPTAVQYERVSDWHNPADSVCLGALAEGYRKCSQDSFPNGSTVGVRFPVEKIKQFTERSLDKKGWLNCIWLSRYQCFTHLVTTNRFFLSTSELLRNFKLKAVMPPEKLVECCEDLKSISVPVGPKIALSSK